MTSSQNNASDKATSDAASRLQAILSTAVEGIITIDDKGVIESVNPAAEKLFGYATKEILGRNIKMLMPSPYREEHDGYLKNYRDTGVKKIIGVGREVVGRRKDGSEFPVDLAVSEFTLANKTMFAGFIRDLSERRRSEEIAQSLGRIIENLFNEVYIFDAESLKFVRVNRGARENLGFTMQELEALTPLDIKPEHTLDSFSELMAPLRNGKAEKIAFEAVHARKDGSRYDVEVHLQKSLYQGKHCYAAIILDITLRKEAEEAIARFNEKLEQRVDERTQQLQTAQEQIVRSEKLASLGQLAGGVAHEIRNPLGVIRNAVYFLQQTLTDVDQDTKDSLDEITRGLHSSERIIRELLDYARGSKSERSDVLLSETITAALGMVTIPESVSVQTDLSEIYINADRGQIERLFANLIHNAVRAMPDGGNLTICCRAFRNEVSTEVIDSGVGIPPEELEKIFEPLYTKRAQGIGLGLSICRLYAEQHGGKLRVESKLAEGSKFVLTLPVASAEGPTT